MGLKTEPLPLPYPVSLPRPPTHPTSTLSISSIPCIPAASAPIQASPSLLGYHNSCLTGFPANSFSTFAPAARGAFLKHLLDHGAPFLSSPMDSLAHRTQSKVLSRDLRHRTLSQTAFPPGSSQHCRWALTPAAGHRLPFPACDLSWAHTARILTQVLASMRYLLSCLSLGFLNWEKR